MLAFVYPPRTMPTQTDVDPSLALATTGVLLLALVLFAWAAMRRGRREEAEGPAAGYREMPRAA